MFRPVDLRQPALWRGTRGRRGPDRVSVLQGTSPEVVLPHMPLPQRLRILYSTLAANRLADVSSGDEDGSYLGYANSKIAR